MKESLNDVRRFLDTIDCINCGGCGISMLAMYRWLKKHNMLAETKLVFLYNSKDSYLNNQGILRQHNGIPEAPSHCCLLHDGEFIDSNVYGNPLIRYPWVQIIDEEEFVKQAINNISTWNHMFERSNIWRIQKELDIDLSDIDY